VDKKTLLAFMLLNVQPWLEALYVDYLEYRQPHQAIRQTSRIPIDPKSKKKGDEC
jgi:hypothetical protein